MNNDERFDRLLEELRDETPSAEVVDAAKARVRARLETPVCAGFQLEFAGYRAGTLLESRRLLVEDHLSRCATCRRTLGRENGETNPSVIAMPVSRWSQTARRYSKIAAAAAFVAVGLYAGRGRIDSALAPSGPRATVEAVSGKLVLLSTGRTLAGGAVLGEGEVVRTASGSRAALRLADGSMVEMNERSELRIRGAWSGQRILLERGDVIVQAAKQRRGHLQLMTRDTTSSVKGTVFAVSTGVAGSVVSVMEGAVEVAQGGGPQKLVKPGQQVHTAEVYAGYGVRDAISWSPNAEKYFALVAEFATLEKEISAVLSPGLRTQSALLKQMPLNTILYAAVPNSDGAINRAVRLVENRARENEVLKEWWESHADLKTVLGRLQEASALLGNEVVLLLAADPAGAAKQIPLILAEIKTGREAALKEVMDKVVTSSSGGTYKIVGSLLLISRDQSSLARLQPLLGLGASSPFAAEIAQRYTRGAGWLWALDAGRMVTLETKPGEHSLFAVLGLSQLRHVVFEQRGMGGRDDNEVSASFQGARQGVASWLAAPAAFGSPEYISPNAITAVAAVTRNPRQAVDELIRGISAVRPGILDDLREFERSTGINFANDIASSIGNDFSLAVETISIPVPGWVGAVEISSPVAIDSVLQRMVEASNRHFTSAGQPQNALAISKETVNGRVWNALTNAAKTQMLHWTYDGGYMVMGPDRAILTRAIATRASGTPLVRSARFREMQPATPSVHGSGFLWLNTRGALDSLLAVTGSAAPSALRSLLTSRDPVLVILSGETERIAAYSRTRLTSLLIDLMVTQGAKGAGGGGGRTIQKKLHAIGG